MVSPPWNHSRLEQLVALGGIINIHNSIDESQNSYAEQKETENQECILYDSPHTEFLRIPIHHSTFSPYHLFAQQLAKCKKHSNAHTP